MLHAKHVWSSHGAGSRAEPAPSAAGAGCSVQPSSWCNCGCRCFCQSLPFNPLDAVVNSYRPQHLGGLTGEGWSQCPPSAPPNVLQNSIQLQFSYYTLTLAGYIWRSKIAGWHYNQSAPRDWVMGRQSWDGGDRFNSRPTINGAGPAPGPYSTSFRTSWQRVTSYVRKGLIIPLWLTWFVMW